MIMRFGFAIGIVFAAGILATPASAARCDDPAEIERLYDTTLNAPRPAGDREAQRRQIATVRAAAILLWELRGRDGVAGDGKSSYWAANGYSSGTNGFPQDRALADAINADFRNGNRDRTFRERAPMRPPAEAVRLALEALNCDAARSVPAPQPQPQVAVASPRCLLRIAPDRPVTWKKRPNSMNSG